MLIADFGLLIKENWLTDRPHTSAIAFDMTIKKAASFRIAASKNNPGSDLLSHAVTHALLAVESLTSVFGMGTGVTPLL